MNTGKTWTRHARASDHIVTGRGRMVTDKAIPRSLLGGGSTGDLTETNKEHSAMNDSTAEADRNVVSLGDAIEEVMALLRRRGEAG